MHQFDGRMNKILLALVGKTTAKPSELLYITCITILHIIKKIIHKNVIHFERRTSLKILRIAKRNSFRHKNFKIVIRFVLHNVRHFFVDLSYVLSYVLYYKSNLKATKNFRSKAKLHLNYLKITESWEWLGGMF